jgi:CPA2 family monovalent cation:H+ antiporter-2
MSYRNSLLDRFIALTTAHATSGNATTTTTTLPERLLPFLNVGDEISTIVIFDLAIIMVIAAVMAAISFRLKQPMILGYIIAGIVIGPFTPPFPLVGHIDTINLLAELGIIMLLFVIGTEFPVSKLRSLGRISVVVALSETIITLMIVFYIAQTLGFSYFDSLFLALAMSITSTVVTVRVLEELGMLRDKSSTLILGISIMEDILAVAILAVLQSIAISSANGQEISITAIALSVGIVAAFVGSILTVGSKFMPRIIDRAGKTNDYALLLIVILGLAFGLSFVAIALGLSVATGAFLAGVLVAESKSGAVARIITIPLRDMFAAIFFISMGALMNIALVPAFIVPAIILILVSFASKFLIVAGILSRTHIDNTTTLRTGLGMSAARGELSLVVVKGGQDVGAITSALLPILGVVTIVTTFITPYIIKFGARLSVSKKEEEEEAEEAEAGEGEEEGRREERRRAEEPKQQEREWEREEEEEEKEKE